MIRALTLCLILCFAASAAAVGEALPEYRSIDGYGNNLSNPDWGSSYTPLIRVAPPTYADEVCLPPITASNPRAVSNIVCAQRGEMPNETSMTDLFWQWGQFLDHDIDLTPSHFPLEPYPVQIPTGDPQFDPEGTGTQSLTFFRSLHQPTEGVRQQVNVITAFIDGSQIYGSDEDRARALRALDGTGKLKTSAGNLLPFNEDGFVNAPNNSSRFFLAGDERANEQVGLLALHTVFMREHNFQADRLREQNPELSGDEIYNQARAIVGAELQVITYNEFLPKLLGDQAMTPYQGYDEARHPGILNEFSTGAYRLGHSMLSPKIDRLDASLAAIPEGPLTLRDAFFSPEQIVEGGGLEPILRGMAHHRAQEMDPFIVDEVRNFLFGEPGEGGLDLAALNIQRGRDHGLAFYNDACEAFGLPRKHSLAEITKNTELQNRLVKAYGVIDELDFWVGALGEDHVEGAMVGALVQAVLIEQFEALRDGDRFWYENIFSAETIAYLEEQTLGRIIRRNTAIETEIPDDAFTYPDYFAGASSQSPFSLGAPFPNPMNSSGAIPLLVESAQDRVRVSIYDVHGKVVRQLKNGALDPGRYLFHWDRTTEAGRAAPSGIYFIHARAGSFDSHQRVVLLP